MGEFLVIMLSIIFYLTPKAPKEVESVQIWPYATDANPRTKEMNLIFHRTQAGWYLDGISTNSRLLQAQTLSFYTHPLTKA